MDINVEKLRIKTNKLNKQIEEYESNYYNLYNELSNCSTCWNDTNSNVFFDNISLEKIEVSETINELKSIIELYEYLVNKYSEFGTKIKIKEKNKNELLKKIDDYLVILYDILDDFRNLDYGFDKIISNNIYRYMDNLVEITNSLVDSKSIIKKHLISFEEIEKEVSLKISKININILKENDISKFI